MDEKSPHYVLVMDRTRDTILGVLLSAGLDNPIGMMSFIKMLKDENIPEKEAMDFIGLLADKTHEMGWCTDPNCKEKQPTNQT